MSARFRLNLKQREQKKKKQTIRFWQDENTAVRLANQMLSHRNPSIHLTTHFSFYCLIKKITLPVGFLHASLRSVAIHCRYSIFIPSPFISLTLTIRRGVHQHQRLLPQSLNVLQHAGKLQGKPREGKCAEISKGTEVNRSLHWDYTHGQNHSTSTQWSNEENLWTPERIDQNLWPKRCTAKTLES